MSPLEELTKLAFQHLSKFLEGFCATGIESIFSFSLLRVKILQCNYLGVGQGCAPGVPIPGQLQAGLCGPVRELGQVPQVATLGKGWHEPFQ